MTLRTLYFLLLYLYIYLILLQFFPFLCSTEICSVYKREFRYLYWWALIFTMYLSVPWSCVLRLMFNMYFCCLISYKDFIFYWFFCYILSVSGLLRFEYIICMIYLIISQNDIHGSITFTKVISRIIICSTTSLKMIYIILMSLFAIQQDRGDKKPFFSLFLYSLCLWDDMKQFYLCFRCLIIGEVAIVSGRSYFLSSDCLWSMYKVSYKKELNPNWYTSSAVGSRILHINFELKFLHFRYSTEVNKNKLVTDSIKQFIVCWKMGRLIWIIEIWAFCQAGSGYKKFQ